MRGFSLPFATEDGMLCFDELLHIVTLSPKFAWQWCWTGVVILSWSSFTDCYEAKPSTCKLLLWVDVADEVNPCCIRWNVKFSVELLPQLGLPNKATEEVPFSCFPEGDIKVLCFKKLCSQSVHVLAVLSCSKPCCKPLLTISVPLYTHVL